MNCFGIGLVHIPQTDYDFSPVIQKIQSWVDKGYYQGAGLLVAKDGRTIFKQNFGVNSDDTVVYIASAGKWLAAATIAAVVDDRKLHWADRANQWLPELKDVKGQATLRQLMSHTAGYQEYQPSGNPVDNYQTVKESVAHIVPLPPKYEPGTHFDYGGLAMQVAGRMGELASGKDFESLFQEKIATPLGMRNTHFTPVNTEGGHSPMLGGGARTTLTDYARFLEMISNDGMFRGRRILSHKAVAEMQSDQVRGAEIVSEPYVKEVRNLDHNGVYGLGEWREVLDDRGDAVLISSPSWAGAYPWIDKERKLYGWFIAHISGNGFTEHFNSFLSSPHLADLVSDVVDRAELPKVHSDRVLIKGGVHLAYDEAGSGPTILLLHAHSVDRHMWDSVFAHLVSHFHVLRLDFRGYGASDMPIEGQPFTHADDVAEFLKAKGIAKANLVGLSLGGLVVTDMLALHPDLIASATITSGAIHDMPGIEQETSDQRSKRYAAEKEAQLANIANFNEGLFKEQWKAAMYAVCGPHLDRIKTALDEMIDRWQAWQPSHYEVHCLADLPIAARLRANPPKMPILAIIGEHDSAGSKDSMAKLIQLAPTAKVYRMKDAGHWNAMECPEEFCRLLTAFIKQSRQEKSHR